MNIEFDPRKDEKNTEKHGVSLADAARLEWDWVWLMEALCRQNLNQVGSLHCLRAMKSQALTRGLHKTQIHASSRKKSSAGCVRLVGPKRSLPWTGTSPPPFSVVHFFCLALL